MTITMTLADPDRDTDVHVDEGLPLGLSTADNGAAWRSSLAKLAELVESS